MVLTRDPELESFKTGIDLRIYAAALGYELDRRESWRGSSVMRDPKGDKVIVKRDTDQHYVYFSVRDEADNGSIIDFVMPRKGFNLGRRSDTPRSQSMAEMAAMKAQRVQSGDKWLSERRHVSS